MLEQARGPPYDRMRGSRKGPEQGGSPPSVLRAEDVNMVPREHSPYPQMNRGAAKGGDLREYRQTSQPRGGNCTDARTSNPRGGNREKDKPSQLRGGPLAMADAVIDRPIPRLHAGGRDLGRNSGVIGVKDIIERTKIRKHDFGKNAYVWLTILCGFLISRTLSLTIRKSYKF